MRLDATDRCIDHFVAIVVGTVESELLWRITTAEERHGGNVDDVFTGQQIVERQSVVADLGGSTDCIT